MYVCMCIYIYIYIYHRQTSWRMGEEESEEDRKIESEGRQDALDSQRGGEKGTELSPRIGSKLAALRLDHHGWWYFRGLRKRNKSSPRISSKRRDATYCVDRHPSPRGGLQDRFQRSTVEGRERTKRQRASGHNGIRQLYITGWATGPLRKGFVGLWMHL